MAKEVREQLVKLVRKSVESYGSDSEYYEEAFDALAEGQGLSGEETSQLWDEIEDELPEECFAW